MVNHWLLQRGFSVGIGDSIAPRDTMELISKIISEAKGKVQQTLESAQVRALSPVTGSLVLVACIVPVSLVLVGLHRWAGKYACVRWCLSVVPVGGACQGCSVCVLGSTSHPFDPRLFVLVCPLLCFPRRAKCPSSPAAPCCRRSRAS